MTELTPDVRADVSDVLVRYATGIDRRDWPLFRTCFTDDCDVDYGAIGAWRGLDDLTAWMDTTHAGCGHTMHRMMNIALEPADTGVRARTYVDAIVLGPDNASGTRAAGYYDDELVPTGEGWRIARRRFTMVHVDTVTNLAPSG